MLPLFDENPTRRMPLATFLLIGLSVAIHVAANLGPTSQPVTLVDDTPSNNSEAAGVRELPNDLRFALEWGAIPCEVTQGRPLNASEISDTYYETGDPTSCDAASPIEPVFAGKRVNAAVVLSIFLHDGWFHLALNMLFLWVFGNNIEDRLGPVLFLGFYLLSGVLGTLAYIVAQASGTVAILGASGAVAGIMGSYLVWYPDAPIRTLVFLVVVDIRARWFLGTWFALQFFTWRSPGSWVAHVAGFVFGVIFGRLVRKFYPRLANRRSALRAESERSESQRQLRWDPTGGAGHGPYPHLDEVWDEPHHERYS
ncbi:MAG: rhomboid family intramembrane serine protease [Acidimicrobiales bacterium]